MADCTFLLKIVRIFAAIVGIIAVVMGALCIYNGIVHYRNDLIWFVLGGLFLIIAGLFMVAAEAGSFFSFGGDLQSLVVRMLNSPLWIRGIVYILLTLPTSLLIHTRNTYTATGLMVIVGIIYIILGCLISTTTVITTTQTV